MTAPGAIAVLGAGNLGLAQAGHLSLLGHQVRLFNRSSARLGNLTAGQPVTLHGALSGTARLGLATTDLARAVEGAALVFVDVPASGHAEVARALKACLSPSAELLLVLHPGQTFGARHFARCLALERFPKLVLAELQTALYTARAGSPADVNLLAVKHAVWVATYPGAARSKLAPLLALYPQLEVVPTTLSTALANVQAYIHPAVCLLNAARIERAEPFLIYREGLTDAVSACFEGCDRERLALAQALGIVVPTAAEWFGRCYGVRGDTAVEAMRRVAAYDRLEAPRSLSTRLLTEDVPTGLVPLCELARALDVSAPTLSGLLSRCAALGVPVKEPWTLEGLGLAGLTRAELASAFS